MTAGTTLPAPPTLPAPAARGPRRLLALVPACACLALFMALALPLFVCMPLTPDVTLYDLGARSLLRGGVEYRDVFDNNMPGIHWLHVGIRSAVGWRSEALRAVDVLIVAAVVWLLAGWVAAPGRSRAAPIWTALVLFAFYFSTT